MSQLANIHTAIAKQVKRVLGNSVNVAGWPYSGVSLPRIEVWPDNEYNDPYGDSDDDAGPTRVNLTLRLQIATGQPEDAHRLMTTLLGWEAGSIRAALMSDRKLGGVCDDLLVSGPVMWDTDADSQAQGGWVPVTVYVQKEN